MLRWRRGRDSNPRYGVNRTHDFQSCTFNRSVTSPLSTNKHLGTLLCYFKDISMLLKRLRGVHYDLAVDVSCSQSAMGAFLVGLSRARLRAGMQGKWDRWLNIKVAKSGEVNKYKTLPKFLTNLGINCESPASKIALSDLEREAARNKIAALTQGRPHTRTIGVFVGGRKSWGKRWSTANFCELITALYDHE